MSKATAARATARNKNWPPLPAIVDGVLGPIPVLLVENLMDPDNPTKPLWGYFDMIKREIQIRANLSPDVMWATLEHEIVHAAFWDVGLTIKDDDLEESICDAIAAARVCAIRASL